MTASSPRATSRSSPRAAARSEVSDKVDVTSLRAEAMQALGTLGFRPSIARVAVDEALGHVAHRTSLDDLIREGLPNRCTDPILA